LKYQAGSKLTYPLDMVAIFIIDQHTIEQKRCRRPHKEQQCHVWPKRVISHIEVSNLAFPIDTNS
jgi:hypothetical protein